jgi:hypothetical protein
LRPDNSLESRARLVKTEGFVELLEFVVFMESLGCMEFLDLLRFVEIDGDSLRQMETG